MSEIREVSAAPVTGRAKKLILEDGSVYSGTGFGCDLEKRFEIVFNISMVGYQEIISDPSYTDQGVVMTYPLIGNYGMAEDDYESEVPSLSALIVSEYCDEPSNFRGKRTLSEIMEKYKIAGLFGIDTRKLARHIRDFGTCKACIVDGEKDVGDALDELRRWIPPTDAVSRVSTKEAYLYNEGKSGSDRGKIRIYQTENASKSYSEEKAVDIVAIDCGIKKNILREMSMKGLNVTVVPFDTPPEEILSRGPSGVFISNGPGDPGDASSTIDTVKGLIGKIPIFGICLGHQIISLAYGAKTYKLKFGHRGGNHPVKNLLTDKIEITSQNHSYAVLDESLKKTRLTATHVNLLDNTIEGVECREDRVFSVQYHPESAPGPCDSAYLFDRFIDIIKKPYV